MHTFVYFSIATVEQLCITQSVQWYIYQNTDKPRLKNENNTSQQMLLIIVKRIPRITMIHCDENQGNENLLR